MSEMTKEQAVEVFAGITGGAPDKTEAGVIRARIFRIKMRESYDQMRATEQRIVELKNKADSINDVATLAELAKQMDQLLVDHRKHQLTFHERDAALALLYPKQD